MKILTLLFGYIFQGNTGHTIVKRNAEPISATNFCINECTGVADDWQDYGNNIDGGIMVDGELCYFNNFYAV